MTQTSVNFCKLSLHLFFDERGRSQPNPNSNEYATLMKEVAPNPNPNLNPLQP